MTNIIEDALLQKDTNNSFSTECLIRSTFQNRENRRLYPHNQYAPPTPQDFAMFKDMTYLSTGDICCRFQIPRKSLRQIITDKGYESGKYLDYTIWRNLIESAGLVTREFIKPRYINIKPEVINSNRMLPTRDEFFTFMRYINLNYEQVAFLMGTDVSTIKENAVPGQTKLDKNLEFVRDEKHDSDIHTNLVNFDIQLWRELLNKLNIQSYDDLKLPPALPMHTLCHEFEEYWSADSKHKKMTEEEKEQLKTTSPLYESLTAHSYNETSTTSDTQQEQSISPYFQNITGFYQAPNRRELNSLITWSGFNLVEIAQIAGLEYSQLRFLLSSNSEKLGKTIRYSNWRRLLEVFNLVQQITITTK